MEADVNLLARLIARTLRPEIIRVTLVSVSSDMCRKFHSDHVPVRALCSYHGAGTLWLDNHDVIRGELGCPGHGSFEEANAAVMKPGAKVRQLSRGWVAWMKGEAWPGNEGNGLVHRSPPHDPAAGPRLILKLDALYPGGFFPRQ
ncbi:MAG: hypothetical protein GMKNLPBB_00759 [Myxococcota bacterium]|nr:hypothetical protein [Myxococcota bacterium]